MTGQAPERQQEQEQQQEEQQEEQQEGERDGAGAAGLVAAPVTTQPPGPGPGLGGAFWKLWTASTVSKIGDGVVLIAIPWLTTELTSSALLVALMGVAVRLPWLLFSLPAGVWADRVDRRLLMLGVNLLRAAVVLVTGLLVWADAITLPLLFAVALALGCCEVVFDNTSQVLLPSVVDRKRLEAANGRLMGAQMVLGEFVGRPVTGVLIGVGLALPFFFDAVSALVSVLVLLAVRGSFRAGRGDGRGPRPADAGAGPPPPRRPMRAEIAEGMRWLWSHPLLRPLAIALAWSNAMSAAAFSIFILYAKEILGLGAAAFALLSACGALGGFLGSFFAARVSRRIGPSRCLLLATVVFAVDHLTIGATSTVWLVAAASVLAGMAVVLWNVITVSLRQTLVPDGLLGRVNSCYRLLGWGCMPIGMALGGALVTAVEHTAGREAALRAPFLTVTVLSLGLMWFMRRRLNAAAIRRALEAPAAPAAPAAS
ncbi:MFS transporter [Streptomyces aidingensis]|uniref:Transmembrane secretion effector n=1 Tax=Streptomyces aidingensis TaxID=910347 RepID=A0A1I1GM95_9ACTN|nr:MFS transporter [Streptomyces aidingensis]SFC12919.1 Transmembrane secretion effector [Streptomyces aidingensis]